MSESFARDSVQLFLQFLVDSSIQPAYNAETTADIDEVISKNFHVLKEDTLRKLAASALAHRDEALQRGGSKINDENLFGNWTQIIDGIKSAVVRRREVAASNFQRLVELGQLGEVAKVECFLRRCYDEGFVDYLFEGILMSTLEECKKAGMNDNYYMIEHFRATIETMRVTGSESFGGVQKLATQESSLKISAASPISTVRTTSDASSSSDGAAASRDMSNANHQSIPEQSNRSKKVAVVEDSNVYLQELLKECAGDVPKLKAQILEGVRSGFLDDQFDKTVDEVVETCTEAGLVNKAKLFSFIANTIRAERAAMSAGPLRTTGHVLGEHATTASADIAALNMYHAPKFLGEDKENDKSLSDGGKMAEPRMPEEFIDGSVAAISDKLKNNKKKSAKKAARGKVATLAERMGAHLDAHGWAVCDNFLPLDIVRRVKVEAGLFRQYYEQSEIWVGKEADIGAHLQVPSVRGDRVLWMCGGHTMNSPPLEDSNDKVLAKKKGVAATAPEGVSRAVHTLGEIEPCKLEIKASAPVRKFEGIREVMVSLDKLIEEMKSKVEKMRGIYDRSDVMLAEYPGDGSRFARHVDNTTGDGRRLTVLLYLNPGWKPEDGGALRLTKLVAPAVDRASTAGNGSASGDIISAENAGAPEDEVVDVLPVGGRLAMFYSSEIPHEVLPTYGHRHALTIWYYDSKERAEAVRAAQESGRAAKVSQATPATQRAAKDFIAELMGGDEVEASGGDPTKEELAELAGKVKKLSDDVLSIVANITGAPSTDSFRTGFELLVPEDLKAMRKLFRNMGLQ